MTLPMRLGLGQFNTLTDEMLTFIKQIGVDDFLMTPFGAPWTASTAPTTGSTSAWVLVGDWATTTSSGRSATSAPGARVRVDSLRRIPAATRSAAPRSVRTSGSGNAGQRLLTELLDGIQCLPHVVPGRGVVEDAQPEGKGPV